jgi:hypothetical protein
MKTLRQAAELALDAMKDFDYDKRMAAIEAVEQALAEPEQEPEATRQWVGLSDEEIDDAARFCVKSGQSVNAALRAIEAKLKEKNT